MYKGRSNRENVYEIASFGGRLPEKGPPSIAVLHYSPLQGMPCPHGIALMIN